MSIPGMDTCAIAMSVNPSGAPPNFVDPPTLAYITYGVVATSASLALIFLGLRLLPFFNGRVGLKVDDGELHAMYSKMWTD